MTNENTSQNESVGEKDVSERFESHEYGVIYLDILGQKELMEKIEEGKASPESEEQMQKVLLRISSFLYELVKLRERTAPDRASKLYEWFIKNKIGGLNKKELKESLNDLRFGIQQFSDTTMIYVRLDGMYPFMAHQLFSSLLCSLASSLFQYLKEGVFIRGAVAKGVGWELGMDNLYGPVIRDVYLLEEKVARWSRVVVSSDVVALYKNVLGECERMRQMDAYGVKVLKSTFVTGLDGVCQLSLFPTIVLREIAENDGGRERSRRTLKYFFNIVKIINGELKSYQEELERNPTKIVETSKLILRTKMFKQEVMNGILRFIDICRKEGVLSEDECKGFKEKIQNEIYDEMGFATPLKEIFEEWHSFV